MTADQLKALAVDRFGPDRWQKDMAAFLGSDVSTVRRWINGVSPIPGPVQAAMRLCPKRKR